MPLARYYLLYQPQKSLLKQYKNRWHRRWAILVNLWVIELEGVQHRCKRGQASGKRIQEPSLFVMVFEAF